MENADIIIIGGGSAGCVLAARLTEQPGLRVTLVEAGIDTQPGHVPPDISDVFPRAYANPIYFWPDLKAIARSGSATRPYSQARIMGGGSTVMGLWAVRGLTEDYDNWAAGGAPGWSYAEVLPFFKKLERDFDIRSPEHGADGPVAIRRIQPQDWPGFNKAMAAAAERHGLPTLPDLNSTAVEGVFAIPTASDGAARVSAPSAYLTDIVRRRPNLKLVPETEVRSILFEGQRAVGVTLRRGDGSTGEVRAAQVIVSAGAIHSPALLLRSGIGAAGELSAAGIPVIADLPEVGRNLQNHVFIHLGAIIRPEARQNPGLRAYAMAGARVSSGLAGAPRGDLFLSFIARTSGRPDGNRFGMVGPSLYAPFSRGRVGLAAADPAGTPTVDFNLMQDSRDSERLVHASRLARTLLQDERVSASIYETFILPPNPPIRLLNSPGMKSTVINTGMAAVLGMGGAVRKAALRQALGPGRLLSEIKDEATFAELALASATPMFHPAGTCAMGTVVDSSARVKGVEGLRVVDASIMPVVPRANTNIPTIMVAEKCASHILADLAAGSR